MIKNCEEQYQQITTNMENTRKREIKANNKQEIIQKDAINQFLAFKESFKTKQIGALKKVCLENKTEPRQQPLLKNFTEVFGVGVYNGKLVIHYQIDFASIVGF